MLTPAPLFYLDILYLECIYTSINYTSLATPVYSLLHHHEKVLMYKNMVLGNSRVF